MQSISFMRVYGMCRSLGFNPVQAWLAARRFMKVERYMQSLSI